ncbi:MAG: zinc metalloprotease HtpX [Actinomycetota bacterium]|nr:zinc metalloprotease HtpX [Actinomycetota bacterium]
MGKNTVKTFVFLALLTSLLLFAGSLFSRGYLIMIPIVVLMNFAGYFWSDKMVLRATHSRPVTEQEAPWLYKIVRELTQKNGMPMPKLYIMPASQPNAFATGRNPQHAAVAVTEGILGVLDEEELKGVLAHEISHVHNRDILIGAVAAMVAGAITLIARMAMWGAMFGGGDRDDNNSPLGAIGAILGIILAPIAALLIQMAVSRSREAQADASGAKLLGDATPLAHALVKIDAAAKTTAPMNVSPAVSHVFLQNPFRGQNVSKLFLSHPPLEQRLAQLRELGAKI